MKHFNWNCRHPCSECHAWKWLLIISRVVWIDFVIRLNHVVIWVVFNLFQCLRVIDDNLSYAMQITQTAPNNFFFFHDFFCVSIFFLLVFFLCFFSFKYFLFFPKKTYFFVHLNFNLKHFEICSRCEKTWVEVVV